MERKICCIVCPNSCIITVKGDGKQIESMEGYQCKRGQEYAENEYLAPKRMLTTTVKAEGYKLPTISVRSEAPLPKERILDCMEVLRHTVAQGPFDVGKVVVENILGTGVNIILTNC